MLHGCRWVAEAAGRSRSLAGSIAGSRMETPNLPLAVLAEQTRLQILSRPEWIEPTVDYLKHKALLCGACSESRIDRLLLALHEGLTNAVVHGNLEISSELKERDDHAFIETLAHRAADPNFHRRRVDITVH